MTRQKKELLKEIIELENGIEADMELGCGFAPADAYAETEHYIYTLYEKLAVLSHYKSVEDMMYDKRRYICYGYCECDPIPFE